MEWIELPVKKLNTAKWNYKATEPKETEFLMGRLKENFKRNGQIENIIVRETPDGYEVVNGNHRLMVARDLKRDSLMCYNLGMVNVETAKRIAIETNETKFESDQIKLADIILELKDDDDFKFTNPFTDEETKRYLRMAEFNWEDLEDGEDEIKDTAKDFTTIKLKLPPEVAEQFTAQIERFKKVLYPDKDTKDVGQVFPIEAMVQILNQTTDGNITGE